MTHHPRSTTHTAFGSTLQGSSRAVLQHGPREDRRGGAFVVGKHGITFLSACSKPAAEQHTARLRPFPLPAANPAPPAARVPEWRTGDDAVVV